MDGSLDHILYLLNRLIHLEAMLSVLISHILVVLIGLLIHRWSTRIIQSWASTFRDNWWHVSSKLSIELFCMILCHFHYNVFICELNPKLSIIDVHLAEAFAWPLRHFSNWTLPWRCFLGRWEQFLIDLGHKLCFGLVVVEVSWMHRSPHKWLLTAPCLLGW